MEQQGGGTFSANLHRPVAASHGRNRCSSPTVSAAIADAASACEALRDLVDAESAFGLRRPLSRGTATILHNSSDSGKAAMELVTELQRIYDSEINIEISWLWDGGIEVRLGDRMNGYLAEIACHPWPTAWLQEAIAHFYRGSL